MNSKKTHVYFVPGLAAGKEIFKNIHLPDHNYKVHILEWMIPAKKDTIQDYAKKMASLITETNVVLVGVSFGGVIAQEMSGFLNLKKLIIISSVKTKFELPKRLKLLKKTRAYKLAPTGWALSVKDLTKWAIGPRSKKRLKLYQEYLSVRDKTYLNWAIEQMVCWEREEIVEGVIHIHGSKDMVFPISTIVNPIVVEDGTHVMILHRASSVSKLLLNCMEN